MHTTSVIQSAPAPDALMTIGLGTPRRLIIVTGDACSPAYPFLVLEHQMSHLIVYKIYKIWHFFFLIKTGNPLRSPSQAL